MFAHVDGEWVRYEDVVAGEAEPVADVVVALKACLQCFDEMRGRKPGFVEDSIAMSKEALAKYEATPTAQPQPQPERMVLFDDRPQNQRIAEAEARMRNPAPLQFEDEAAQPDAPWTDPLLGRYAKAVERVESAQPEAPAEPSAHEPGSVEWWLRSALDCPEFHWDQDQRECAEGVLKARLAAPVAQQPAELTDAAIEAAWQTAHRPDGFDKRWFANAIIKAQGGSQ
jgi:hypothetical protein